MSTDPRETGEQHDVQGLHAPIMREKSDPRDGFEPIPTWMAGALGVVVFFAGYYLQSFSGDFRPDVFNEVRPAYGLAAKPEAKPDPFAQGKKLFAGAGCVACHQADGKGQAGQIPPLAGSEWVAGSPSKLSRILLHGLQGSIKVLDAPYNNNMPAFGAKLDDEKIAAVLTYIRGEKGWGNTADPIPTETVAAARAATRDRNSPWTAAELDAIREEDKAEPTSAKASDGARAPSDAQEKAGTTGEAAKAAKSPN